VLALLLWVAIATYAGLSQRTVWAGTFVSLIGIASCEAVVARARVEEKRAAVPSSTRATQPTRPVALGSRPGAPPIATGGPPLVSHIELPSTFDNGTFARFVPFGDAREVIVRRGKELGFNYGHEQSRRTVVLHGREFTVVRARAILSPPPLRPGQAPMSREAARQFTPESEVLYLPDAEVLLRREPNGFSDAEVERILAAISFQ
jgi:hypothetical protein